MQRPSTEGLGQAQRRAARAVAQRLASRGLQAWIVGGAVRDLALGRPPRELDMVSAATPDLVEELFERTLGVGRAFGIVKVWVEGSEVELATFRTEGSYRDGRRPEEVRYGSSLEEDAARRDFTANALYLDPLTDEVVDPTGGLADLEAGRLVCVGEAAERFREDGLRLLRMARLAAALDLEPAPGMVEAARGAAPSLAGVSPERVRGEVTRIFEGPGSRRALELLGRADLLGRALPGWREASAIGLEQRLEAWAALPDPPGAVLGWALLLEADPLGSAGPGEGEATLARDLERAALLRPSRALLRALERVWRLRRDLVHLASPEARPSARIRALGPAGWEDALHLALAWAGPAGTDTAPLVALGQWRRSLGEADLAPDPWIRSEDLAETAVPRGPLWGQVLEEALDLQLDGHLGSRAQALAWLGRRAEALGH